MMHAIGLHICCKPIFQRGTLLNYTDAACFHRSVRIMAAYRKTVPIHLRTKFMVTLVKNHVFFSIFFSSLFLFVFLVISD